MKTVLHVPQELKIYPDDGKTFDALLQIKGDLYREVKGRRTIRFTLNQKAYFIKIHQGTGWINIIKDIICLKEPVLGAENEWKAIGILKELGINTPELVAYGKRGKNPAKMESFVVTKELGNVTSLEDFCKGWKEAPPPFHLKKRLIREVAHITRTLHENGLIHRDLYICHFLIDISNRGNITPREALRLYLIDLHRVQLKKKLNLRWRVKDVAALYFSSMDLGLTRQDIMRFIKAYTGLPGREALETQRPLWKKTEKKARALYKKFQRHMKSMTINQPERKKDAD